MPDLAINFDKLQTNRLSDLIVNTGNLLSRPHLSDFNLEPPDLSIEARGIDVPFLVISIDTFTASDVFISG